MKENIIERMEQIVMKHSTRLQLPTDDPLIVDEVKKFNEKYKQITVANFLPLFLDRQLKQIPTPEH